MTVDGYYEYNIKFSTLLRMEEDVKNILINKTDASIRWSGRVLPDGYYPVREKAYP